LPCFYLKNIQIYQKIFAKWVKKFNNRSFSLVFAERILFYEDFSGHLGYIVSDFYEKDPFSWLPAAFYRLSPRQFILRRTIS